MELRHLRYFLAVAEEGNFTRAAGKLGIGQPPLSQQIRDLEREVGAALFHRVPHGAELTAAGAAFLGEAKASLAAAERRSLRRKAPIAARPAGCRSASPPPPPSTPWSARRSAGFARAGRRCNWR
ncbi:LysR family transcriptional regulator [Rhizobium beringeri]